MRTVQRLAILLFLASLAPVASAQVDWSRWYAGAGLGLGINAHYRQDGGTLDFDEGMPGATDKSVLAAFNVEGGLQLDAKNLLGVHVSSAGKTAKIAGNDAGTYIANYFVMLTHFPRERGFFARVGGGYASIVVDDGITSVRTGGAGIQAGVGYAWHVLTNHYVTLALDQSFQFYHSNGEHRPTRSEFSAATLGYMYRH
jgi:hypothetical protein